MLRKLFNFIRPLSTPQLSQIDVTPVHPKVLLLIHNPRVPSYGGQRLQTVLRWQNPDELVAQYIYDVAAASFGYANYEIVERIEVDGFPQKEDGFIYDGDSYVQRWLTRSGFHKPDRADYGRILHEFQIINKINAGVIDEVWLMGFPYAGYYESRMVGNDAFWCNAPPLQMPQAAHRFVIMGFSYERGPGEMLENLGHRAESIMSHVYRYKRGKANLWDRFIQHEQTHPGQAECGNVHFAPNSERDYDWGNRRKVFSRCHTWLNFPDLAGEPQQVNCSEWGNGDIRQHHLWWLGHMPHVSGMSNGIVNNWWQYIINPNEVQ